MKIGSQMADFKPVFYTNARGVEYGNQSGLTYLDEWSRVAWKDRNVTRRTHEDYELDPVASYRDYALWNYKKMFDSGACDAIYWDDVYACANFDLVGTDAYRLSSGRIQPSVGIFNMRALIRRCAVLQTELGHDCRDNWVHMTNTEIAPVCGFAGVNYDWEDVCGDSPIQERYSRETIQACSLGRQMGNRVAVIGYFSTKDKSSDKLKWLERTGTGACLTHELAWLRVSYWKTEYRKLVEWGYGLPTTRVWNYWSEDEEFPFEIQGPKNAALAMQRADGKMLLIVSDWECGGIYTVRSRQSDFQTTFELAKFDYKILEVER